ncbi:hypothetical protein NHX12_006967 [Muraenolepis orangiensis]|uniref:Uncharacterized protein n=1 Tax=Muraenolepis orangiensis TaxID=630683 RepID=A0A9Q0ICK2_9TELE|nr:hypothetical protein NHX12_006967 [Muraenolepis orangiensis]
MALPVRSNASVFLRFIEHVKCVSPGRRGLCTGDQVHGRPGLCTEDQWSFRDTVSPGSSGSPVGRCVLMHGSVKRALSLGPLTCPRVEQLEEWSEQGLGLVLILEIGTGARHRAQCGEPGGGLGGEGEPPEPSRRNQSYGDHPSGRGLQLGIQSRVRPDRPPLPPLRHGLMSRRSAGP